MDAYKHLVALVAAGLCGAAFALDTRLVASGLDQPLYATAPLNDGRLFVVERAGKIQVVQGGATSEFLSLPVDVTSRELGLLGLAFDPGYANPGSPGYRRFFVNYTELATLHMVVASYRTGDNPSLALANSRTEVLRIDEQAGTSFHKGGWMGFKPGDANSLYINVGDGTRSPSAQSLGSLLGKVLRIDINNDAFPANPNANYAIPADNPFAGTAGARGEVFAWGLRNPWRSGFDRLSGDLWIGDVGSGDPDPREEVNFIAVASAGGQNFGWPYREGTVQGPGGAAPPGSSFVEPVLDYPHVPNASNSVIGGYVVHDGVASLDGQYVFGDFRGGGQVWAMPTDGQSFADATDLSALLNAGQGGALRQIVSFGEGAAGELFIVDITGKVVQVVPEPGTVLLLAGGLVWLALHTRRQRRTASVTRGS